MWQAVLDVQPLEGQVADIHGQVEVRTRNSHTPRAARAASAEPGAQLAGQPGGVSTSNGAPLQPLQVLLFRATDLGIKWIPRVTSQHLLWR